VGNSEPDFRVLNPEEYARVLAEKRAFERAQIPGSIVGVPDGWCGVAVGTSPRADVTILKLTNLGYLPCPGARMVGDPAAKIFIVPEKTRDEMLTERAIRIAARRQ